MRLLNYNLHSLKESIIVAVKVVTCQPYVITKKNHRRNGKSARKKPKRGIIAFTTTTTRNKYNTAINMYQLSWMGGCSHPPTILAGKWYEGCHFIMQ
jgi:uncharacterized protein YpmS